MSQFFVSDDEYLAIEEGGFLARVIADSLSEGDKRLTTFEFTFPRMVLSEFNTHRLLSRNSASSRAIPVSKQVKKILTNPFIPAFDSVRKNQPGMQGTQKLTVDDYNQFVEIWKSGRSRAVLTALEIILGVERTTNALGRDYHSLRDLFLDEEKINAAVAALEEYTLDMSEARKTGVEDSRYLNIHKQTANRVLEPYMWHVVIASATEWENFWYLRDHVDADPQIHAIASLGRKLYQESTPELLTDGQWHMPFVRKEEKGEAEGDINFWKGISTGRCARVSYETHDGSRSLEADIRLYDRLVSDPPHLSPAEHVACPQAADKWSGNFQGFFQHRKELQPSDVA